MVDGYGFMVLVLLSCSGIKVNAAALLHEEADVAVKTNDVECLHVPFPPTDKSRELPWGTVNLDLPPDQRWKSVVEPLKGEINALLDVILTLLVNVTGSQSTVQFLEKEMEKLWATLPEPYKTEMVGVAKYANVPLGYVVLYNVFYDLTSFCTSVIVQDRNGVLYHGRNLDYGQNFGWDMEHNTWLLPSFMRKATLNVRFVNNANETLFEGTQFAGYIGLLTAYKPNGFSLTVNERDTLKHIETLLEWLQGDRNLSWNGLLTRHVLESQTTYQDAKKMLLTEPTLSAAYFILGGVAAGEACVISRRIEQPADVWEMTSIADHPWFILQTNYDHWKPQPFYDDRETPGNYCMQQHGQEVAGYEALFDVLSTPPNLNQATVYTALMCTRCGRPLQSYLQYCPKDKFCPLAI